MVRDSQPSITVNGRTFEAYIPSQEESVIYTQARQKDTNYLARLIAADTPVITFSMNAKHQTFTFDGKGGKKALGRYTSLPFGQD